MVGVVLGVGLTEYFILGVDVCIAAIVDKTLSIATEIDSAFGSRVSVDKPTSESGLSTSIEALGSDDSIVVSAPQEIIPIHITMTIVDLRRHMVHFSGDIVGHHFRIRWLLGIYLIFRVYM